LQSRAQPPTPWWIPPFLGRVPDGVDARALGTLGAVALALLFEEYDVGVLTSALKQIRDDLAIDADALGYYLGVIRLGALPAFLVIPFADRIGRRRVFIGSTMALGLATFATAFSQTPWQFVAWQALTRTFFVSGSAMAFVIVTEEFPARHRGWGLGMLAALGATGHGVGAALYAQIHWLPYGWRFLYGVGIVPVLLLPFFMKRVPETQRFAALTRPPEETSPWRRVLTPLLPLHALASTHPRRALGVAVVGFVTALAMLPTFQFTGIFTQSVHAWSHRQYSLLVIVGGGLGIIGNIVAGHLADRFGRKRAGIALLVMFPLVATGFYRGPGWALWPMWIGLVFCSMGARVITRAMATELFPTDHRGSASGMFSVLETIGAAAGLFVLAAVRGMPATGERPGLEEPLVGIADVAYLADIVPPIACLVLVAAAVLATFPETGTRELEAIG
jgi:MFS family permease